MLIAGSRRGDVDSPARRHRAEEMLIAGRGGTLPKLASVLRSAPSATGLACQFWQEAAVACYQHLLTPRASPTEALAVWRSRMTTFHRTVTTYRQGARTMPGEFYTSPDILREEAGRIFVRQWNCVGRASRLARPGDYVLRTIAGESIIVLRDRGGELRAFFNICRHRGTRLCREQAGQLSETIQCPYHAWTYTTDGRLIGAPHMHEAEGFDKRDYPLHAAAIAEWEGFVFVNLSSEPEPFPQWAAPFVARLSRFGP